MSTAAPFLTRTVQHIAPDNSTVQFVYVNGIVMCCASDFLLWVTESKWHLQGLIRKKYIFVKYWNKITNFEQTLQRWKWCISFKNVWHGDIYYMWHKNEKVQNAFKLDSEDGLKRRKTWIANNTTLEYAMFIWFTQRRNLRCV